MATVRVFVEAEAGSNLRHVYDEATFELRGSRRLSAAYPFPYGFVVGTRTDDGDAVDCYVLTPTALAPGQLVDCEPVGLLEQFEDGAADHKLLAVPVGAPMTLEPGVRGVLQEFIATVFKAYPGVEIDVGRLLGADVAADYVAVHRLG